MCTKKTHTSFSFKIFSLFFREIKRCRHLPRKEKELTFLAILQEKEKLALATHALKRGKKDRLEEGDKGNEEEELLKISDRSIKKRKEETLWCQELLG